VGKIRGNKVSAPGLRAGIEEQNYLVCRGYKVPELAVGQGTGQESEEKGRFVGN
jgi:hypothetical protein